MKRPSRDAARPRRFTSSEIDRNIVVRRLDELGKSPADVIAFFSTRSKKLDRSQWSPVQIVSGCQDPRLNGAEG
jgi:hypothetical protein